MQFFGGTMFRQFNQRERQQWVVDSTPSLRDYQLSNCHANNGWCDFHGHFVIRRAMRERKLPPNSTGAKMRQQR